MRKTKTVLKSAQETEDILCNKCGNSCKVHKEDTNFHGLLEVTAKFHYGSPRDGDVIGPFSLCDVCLTELTSSFKIPCNNQNSFDLGLLARRNVSNSMNVKKFVSNLFEAANTSAFGGAFVFPKKFTQMSSKHIEIWRELFSMAMLEEPLRTLFVDSLMGACVTGVQLWNGRMFSVVVFDHGPQNPVSLQTGKHISVEEWTRAYGSREAFEKRYENTI